MTATDDTTHAAGSQQTDSRFSISRRDIIISGTATTGLLAASTSVGATGDDDDTSDSNGSSKRCTLTVFVTGLEVEGAMADVMVENGTQQAMTDANGTAVFDLEDGTYEVTVSKDGWGANTRTIELGGQDQEIHIPMHASQFNDLDLFVCDASHGEAIPDAAATLSGYGTVYTDENGEAMVMVERMMEPTHHELTVTADGYRTEIRQVTLDDDKHLRIELVSR
jgi:uncharacterized membrane protein